MHEKTTETSRPPAWIVPVLMIAVLGGGSFLLAWTYLFAFSFSSPRGYLETRKDWPKPFVELFAENEIEIYGLPQFLDDRVVAQVDGNQHLIDKLVLDNSLEPTDSTHPVAPMLKRSLPRDWAKWQDAPGDRWYATKDFGTVHLEGQDLFLLVTNRETGRSLIYYNWIF